MMTANFKQYIKNFIKDESGMELMQWLVIILISVLCMGVAFTIGRSIKDTMDKANTEAGNQFKGYVEEIKGANNQG